MKKYCDEITEVCREIVKDGYRLGKLTDDEIKKFEADNPVSEIAKTQAVPKNVIIEHTTV